jgi:hypothetical protein
MNISKWLSDNKSGILSIIACAGVVVTGLLSARAAIKTEETIAEWTEEKHDELTKFEKVQASVKHVILPVASGAATIYCIAKSHRIDKEHAVALVGAAAISAKRYDDYRKANVEVNGMDAHEKVMQKLAADKAKMVNLTCESMCTVCSTGASWDNGEERLFYDSITEQYFTSTLSRVLEAEYHLNRNFAMGYPEVDVQMWCDFLGIKNRYHDTRGWAYNDEFNWLDFNNAPPVDIGDGLEACIIECPWAPIEGYLDYDPLTDTWPR